MAHRESGYRTSGGEDMLEAAMSLSFEPTRTSWDLLLDRGERLLQSTATRAVLSFLIVVSVLPTQVYHAVLPAWLAGRFDPLFLIVFLPEMALRTTILARRAREHRASVAEALVLLADLVALASFLPLPTDLLWLRLLRLSRLVLLVGYWGRLATDLWSVVSSRERRYQIGLVLMLAVGTSFVTAILLFELGPRYDYNGNGVIDAADAHFLHVFWWSFRQLPDPGNLISHPSHLAVALSSLALTFSGLLFFSFIIGISAGVMSEMMRHASERAPGLREHTALVGLGPCSRMLVEDLLAMDRKNRRRRAIAVLGSSETPTWLEKKAYKRVVYRSGDPMKVDDLKRVDVHHAKRVLVMTESGPTADARAVAAVLAIRTCSTRADVFLDVEHEKDFDAARMAGGPKTHVIGAGSLLGYLIAHNAIHPGAHRAVRELLSEAGDDVYTYIFDTTERRRLAQAQLRLAPAALFQQLLRQGVVLLGVFVGGPGIERIADLKVLFNLFDVQQSATSHFEEGCLRSEVVYGLVAVCAHWSSLRDAAVRLLDQGLGEEALPPSPQTSPVPLMRTRAPRRVLICGTSPRVPRVISQLAGYCDSLDVTLLTRSIDHVEIIEDSLRTMVESRCYAAGSKPKPWLPEALPDGRRVRAEFPWGQVNVRIQVLDWTDLGSLMRVDLPGTDVVLFLPQNPDDVSDGLVAIGCLRIADVFTSKDRRFNPDLRVVAQLGDPTKADLLESRLDETSPADESRYTVLSCERLRQSFAVRNLFVLGLSQVLFELLSAQGNHLQRLVPSWPGGKPPEGSFDSGELARFLITHDHLLPIGFEMVGQNEPLLNADSLYPGRRIACSELQAVYVVGRRPKGKQSPSLSEARSAADLSRS